MVIPEPDDSPRIYSRLSSPFHFIPLRIRPFFVYLRSIILLALIHSCGSLVPSILSAVYFFVSLGLTCWWALGKNFARAYLQIIRLLQIYSACHLFAMYLYQLPSIEHYLFQSRITLASRLGFHSLYQHSCLNNTDPLKHHWIIYVHPLITLTLYWVTIYEYHLTRKYHQRMKRVLLEQRQRTSTELENISPNAQSQSSLSGHDGRFHLHSIVDLFWSAPSNDQLNYRTNSLFIALISYTLSKAYILSILAMLFWSITYHSYLTFVYLILACFIWILPRTRYWCHFLSPFFSIYAYLLLILNYIDLLHLFPARYSYFMHEIETLHPDEHRENTVSVRTYVECSIKFGYTLLLLLSLRQRTRELTDQEQHTGQWV